MVVGEDEHLGLAGEPMPAEATGPQEAEADESLEWEVAIDAFRLDGLAALFRDLSLREPGEVSVAALNLLVNDISTAPDHNSTFTLDATLASGGRLASLAISTPCAVVRSSPQWP